jgi:hypothetical protein
MKIMTAEFAQIAFEKKFISKWVFDVEIFARLKKTFPNMEKDTLEIPLFEWYERKGSKLTIKSMLSIPRDLYLIHKVYNQK